MEKKTCRWGLKVGISFICFSAWKKILNEVIRFSVFCLKGQKSNKEGNKNKIASNTDIVLYFHFFVVLLLVVPLCRDTTPPSGMSSDTKTVAFQHLRKCDAQAGGHGEYFSFHVYQTVTHDNMHRGGVLCDGAVRTTTGNINKNKFYILDWIKSLNEWMIHRPSRTLSENYKALK